SLAVLFGQPQIAGLAAHLRDNTTAQQSVITHVAQQRYPLSFAQQRLWFIEQLQPGSNAYHIPYLVKLHDCDLALLEQAINQLVERHPVLNTVYLTDENGVDYQSLLTELITIRQTIEQNVSADMSLPFDLTAEAPIRLSHYVHGGADYLLILFHHIAFDGWSLDIFNAELAEFYYALAQNRAAELVELDINYGDYALWQRQQLSGETLDKLIDYWQQQLVDCENLVLTTDYPRPAIPDYRGDNLYFELSTELSAQLRQLAKDQQTTLYTVLLSGFYVTLAALSGQTDVVIGTPSDNRQQAQTQALIGFFVNSLALRADVGGGQKIEDLIAQVHKVVTEAKVHQDLPLEKLIEVLDIKRDTARHPLFQVTFSVQHFGEDDSSAAPLPYAAVEMDKPLYTPARFDISLYMIDGREQIRGELNYATSLFDRATMKRMAKMVERVLTGFVDGLQSPLNQLELLSEDERQQLLQWSNHGDNVTPSTTLIAQFEAQANRTPNNTAVQFAGQSLTYLELNDRANQLAGLLLSHKSGEGVATDVLIGLYFERGIEMMVGLLAVLKSGAAYVPIGVDYPLARVCFIVEDTQMALVLTSRALLEGLQEMLPSQVQLVAIDEPQLVATVPIVKADGSVDDLAYVIYTSGSTGTPKGVMINHGALAHFIDEARLYLGQKLGQTPNQHGALSTLSLTQYSFDIFGLEYGVSLTSGGLLLLTDLPGAGPALADNRAQYSDQQPQRINFIQQTPSMWQMLLADPVFENSKLAYDKLKNIQIMVGGESGTDELYRNLAERFGSVHQV
ncbi:MAG: condensation domain-containing protein, partial [Psychrosphaera sp.]|nr:condensation domain-containing protein [Psychrosphaera sp.]